MGFDYRELTAKVLFAQGKKDDDDDEGNGTATRCNCCETTQDDDDDEEGNGAATRCECCETTKPHDDRPGRRSAQDLTALRQQLRDALAAG